MSDWTPALVIETPHASHESHLHKPTGALLLLFWRVDHRGQLWWWELHLNRGGRKLCTRIVECRRRQPPPFKAAEAALSAAPK